MVPLSPFVISTNVYEVFIAEKTYIVTFLLFIVYKWAIWHISLKNCPVSAFWERRKWLFILFVISYKQIHMLKTNKMKDFSHEMYAWSLRCWVLFQKLMTLMDIFDYFSLNINQFSIKFYLQKAETWLFSNI